MAGGPVIGRRNEVRRCGKCPLAAVREMKERQTVTFAADALKVGKPNAWFEIGIGPSK
jgi:hypothetical protein